MCEACEKNIYFDTSWTVSDAGYGDTDYGGVAKRELYALLICPVCGKIKDYAITQFGSIENVLIYLYTVNLPEMYDKTSIIEKFTKELDLIGTNKLELILKNSGLKIESGRLTHSCGHTVFTGLKNITHYSKISEILETKGFKFCPNCGLKLLPFNTDLEKDIEMKSMEVDRKKTWDRWEAK